MKRIFLAALIAGLLAGCAASDVSRPIGTGEDTDQLPSSPCACEVFYQGGVWRG